MDPPAAAAVLVNDSIDWRTQLHADSRERIINKITETLRRHLPFHGENGLEELKMIAKRFEERIYTNATSQSDYLRKISLKMMTMETKYEYTTPISMVSNSVGNTGNPPDPETAVSFISWSEEVDRTEQNSYGRFRFYLYSTKLGNVLAAKGSPNQRNPHQMSYYTDTMFVNTFGGQFGRATSERWNTRDDVVNWLQGFISSSSSGSSTNDDNTIVRQEAVNQGLNELSATLDCFFKVMIGNFDKELSIPPKYCRIFNHLTTNQRIILRNGSRSWIVQVNNYVMRGGWEEFVKDHKIKQGEFLVFNHAERNIYDVKFFSCSGCGNRYPWSSDNREMTTTNIITTVAESQQEGGNASR